MDSRRLDNKRARQQTHGQRQQERAHADTTQSPRTPAQASRADARPAQTQAGRASESASETARDEPAGRRGGVEVSQTGAARAGAGRE